MICIACILALYQYKDGIRPAFWSRAGDNSEVVVFTFNGCGAPCDDALAVFHEKAVTFGEVSLTNNSKVKNAFASWVVAVRYR